MLCMHECAICSIVANNDATRLGAIPFFILQQVAQPFSPLHTLPVSLQQGPRANCAASACDQVSWMCLHTTSFTTYLSCFYMAFFAKEGWGLFLGGRTLSCRSMTIITTLIKLEIIWDYGYPLITGTASPSPHASNTTVSPANTAQREKPLKVDSRHRSNSCHKVSVPVAIDFQSDLRSGDVTPTHIYIYIYIIYMNVRQD